MGRRRCALPASTSGAIMSHRVEKQKADDASMCQTCVRLSHRRAISIHTILHVRWVRSCKGAQSGQVIERELAVYGRSSCDWSLRVCASELAEECSVRGGLTSLGSAIRVRSRDRSRQQPFVRRQRDACTAARTCNLPVSLYLSPHVGQAPTLLEVDVGLQKDANGDVVRPGQGEERCGLPVFRGDAARAPVSTSRCYL